MTKTPKQTKTEVIRTFQQDHRDNPALHNLYVRGAWEDLNIAKEACDRLWDQSRVPASIMAGALFKAMAEEITSSAAAFEAAALLFAGLEPPKSAHEEEDFIP